MFNKLTPLALMPTDLPPLSDSSAVEILDFLHELVLRFEAHYAGQIHRYYDQQRDLLNPSAHRTAIRRRRTLLIIGHEVRPIAGSQRSSSDHRHS